MVDDPANGNRITFDACVVWYFEGCDYSEMWEVFAYASNARRAQPVDRGRQIQPREIDWSAHPSCRPAPEVFVRKASDTTPNAMFESWSSKHADDCELGLAPRAPIARARPRSDREILPSPSGSEIRSNRPLPHHVRPGDQTLESRGAARSCRAPGSWLS